MPASPRTVPALVGITALFTALACAPRAVQPPARSADAPDTLAIAALSRTLAHDSMRGRGPWTPESEAAARLLSQELERLGARPVFGERLLVPFTAPVRPRDTVHNVIGVIPGRGGTTSGEMVGITAHFDHLGVGPPDATGDSVYNGFLDAAVPVAMVIDVARRHARAPGDLPLLVMLFNLEEQGLLGARALVQRPDAAPVLSRLRLVIGVDAGSPAGEPLEWQLMGAVPSHRGAEVADSIARSRGWTTTGTPARPISDVFAFAERGVRIIFPIPGARWRGYTAEERAEAMRRFDHYHQPGDRWREDFPWTGTAHFAEWLWQIVQAMSER